MASAVSSYFKADGVGVADMPVNYPADSVNVLKPDSAVRAYLQAGDTAAALAKYVQTSVDKYDASMMEGIKQAEADVIASVDSCPNVKIIMAGYSQGAVAMHDAENWLVNNKPGAFRHIAGTLLLGDPDRVPNTQAKKFGDSAANGEGLRVYLHLVKAHDVPAPGTTANIVNTGDMVGDFQGIPSLENAKADTAVHASYATTITGRRLLASAANWVASTIRPVITTTKLPRATVGKPYSAQLTTADHREGTWKITSGNLPGGLSLSGHTVSGTPTTAGTNKFTLKFTDTHGQTATAIATLTVASGGLATWTAAQAPLPGKAGSFNPSISSVSCGSPTACAAIGQYTNASTATGPMLLTGAGRSWKAVRAPVPAGASRFDLEVNSVSCGSPSFCVAVGRYGDPGDTGGGPWTGLLLTWNGSTWSASPAPLPGDAASLSEVNVESVSCPSASYCVAVGYYSDTSGLGEGLLLTWSNGSWSAEQAPRPANGVGKGVELDHDAVDAVSCASATSCIAVGAYADKSEAEQGLLLNMSEGSWSAQEAPLPANAATGDPYVDIDQVWCSPTSFCLGVSQYENSSGNLDTELLTLSGGSWTAEQAPHPASAEIGGMSCASSTSCFAVESGSRLLLTWSGTTWTAMRAPLPGNAAGGGALGSVSCPSASYCVAVGSYALKSPYQAGLLLTWSGATWSATQSPLPANAESDPWYTAINSISCPSPTSCTAVGVYPVPGITSTYLSAGLLLTMSG